MKKNNNKINLLSETPIIDAFVKQTKKTIMPLRIKNTKVDGMKCVLFNLDQYPNKIDKVYFSSYFTEKKVENLLGGRNVQISLYDFEDNKPKAGPMEYGTMVRNDENRKSFYNIDLTYKSDVSKFAMNDVNCVGDVESLVDKFINAYNSDNWYLFIPKFLRSRKSLDKHNRFWENEIALSKMFYDWYETENCKPRFKTSNEAKKYVLENDTFFATNRLAA